MGLRTTVSLEPAWILHRYPYRDTSLLLEVFSRSHGRIGLVARGARAAKSRWRGQLQGFTPLALSWTQRGELATLTGLEARGIAVSVTGRLLPSACYVNELLLRLITRHDPHPQLFAAYEKTLDELAVDQEPALRRFENTLLRELGYGLLLDREAGSGVPVTADGVYEYRLESGPVRCDNQPRQGLVLHGSSLLALAAGQFDDPRASREVKALMREALALYLGGRPLRSREVMRQLASSSPAAGDGAVR